MDNNQLWVQEASAGEFVELQQAIRDRDGQVPCRSCGKRYRTIFTSIARECVAQGQEAQTREALKVLLKDIPGSTRFPEMVPFTSSPPAV